MVVRDQDGVIRASKSTLHSNISSPFVAEAYACLEATKLVISMGIESVTIMGDSKTEQDGHKIQTEERRGRQNETVKESKGDLLEVVAIFLKQT
ncbi:hypothetical protein Goshw_003019 [Gossypium schwendimanii]|uniref:RNase H type-1 domain-containing protein n=1 Tax=Gossypium schwendimanii TaxID=34291 RepID=A0A7J9MFA4_GOSSC|nr:hypothetical protein [Gossypium schwendimanii]